MRKIIVLIFVFVSSIGCSIGEKIEDTKENMNDRMAVVNENIENINSGSVVLGEENTKSQSETYKCNINYNTGILDSGTTVYSVVDVDKAETKEHCDLLVKYYDYINKLNTYLLKTDTSGSDRDMLVKWVEENNQDREDIFIKLFNNNLLPINQSLSGSEFSIYTSIGNSFFDDDPKNIKDFSCYNSFGIHTIDCLYFIKKGDQIKLTFPGEGYQEKFFDFGANLFAYNGKIYYKLQIPAGPTSHNEYYRIDSKGYFIDLGITVNLEFYSDGDGDFDRRELKLKGFTGVQVYDFVSAENKFSIYEYGDYSDKYKELKIILGDYEYSLYSDNKGELFIYEDSSLLDKSGFTFKYDGKEYCLDYIKKEVIKVGN